MRFGDVSDPASLRAVAFRDPVDVVVSCLASRTGGKKDSWDIDYQARRRRRGGFAGGVLGEGLQGLGGREGLGGVRVLA